MLAKGQLAGAINLHSKCISLHNSFLTRIIHSNYHNHANIKKRADFYEFDKTTQVSKYWPKKGIFLQRGEKRFQQKLCKLLGIMIVSHLTAITAVPKTVFSCLYIKFDKFTRLSQQSAVCTLGGRIDDDISLVIFPFRYSSHHSSRFFCQPTGSAEAAEVFVGVFHVLYPAEADLDTVALSLQFVVNILDPEET